MHSDAELNKLEPKASGFQVGLNDGRSQVSFCESGCRAKTDTGLFTVQNMQNEVNCVSHAMSWLRSKISGNEEIKVQNEDEGAHSLEMCCIF